MKVLLVLNIANKETVILIVVIIMTAFISLIHFFVLFVGLPTIFQLYGESVPPEERGRVFGYLVAAGSVGQTVASVVSALFCL